MMSVERASEVTGESLAFVEQLYAEYLRDRGAVEPEWRSYFDTLPIEGLSAEQLGGPTQRPRGLFRAGGAGGAGGQESGDEIASLQDQVDQLVRAYRVRGHRTAQVDPLGLHQEEHQELDPAFYGFSDEHMGQRFSTRTFFGPSSLTLREILKHLRSTYSRKIGVQFMHIDDVAPKHWLQQRMETSENQLSFDRDTQLRVLTKLTDAEMLEQFIHNKFLGAKRFSLEGGESLIPLIDLALERAGEQGIEEVIFAMAHRGRLNVLVNILGKPPAQVFHEFADSDPERFRGGGDVKYHLGYSSDHTTLKGAKLHLSLCFNPSHLEFVNPVLLGRVRAKQDLRGDRERRKVMPILIHGDAAFAGQGIVQETLNLSELDGYRVGGTIHIIVNNQIGFTTSPDSSRSCTYATDVAKMLQIPIFHVNGEDPEAVAQVVALAMDFRQTFQRDVIIDMWCYRRYGHNEGDEPAFTQPLLYQAIRKRKTVRASYTENLLALGEIQAEEAKQIASERKARLGEALSEARDENFSYVLDYGRGIWSKYRGGREIEVPEVETGLSDRAVAALLHAQSSAPEGFEPHPTLKKLLARRQQMASGQLSLDWGAAEAVAFASLLQAQVNIRLSGQDSGRGTFSHRHSVWRDVTNGDPYIPLNALGGGAPQGHFEVIDSPLSESGVLGFDYGYSLDRPDALVIWEAQFGDFANGAQVIIDQFIVSSEDKWHRLSGLVMLLPHGFEGQGPEHSSARLERFLTLCAEDNIQVCNLTTPAQLFHCLRRQVLRPLRKPLVIMSPKSLLRHPLAVSSLEAFSGSFQRTIADPKFTTPEARSRAKRIICCSGKIYYELTQARAAAGLDEQVAVHRVEQLYPLHLEHLEPLFEGFDPSLEICWVQEEPVNQGAWPFIRLYHGVELLERPLRCIARGASASPATGSNASHKLEQRDLLAEALKLSEA